MKQMIIAGNWKMNKDRTEAVQLTQQIREGVESTSKTSVILGIPFPFLHVCHSYLDGSSSISIAAQNLYPKDSGAFTGEVSGPMLTSCGASYVIVGHSERRYYFGESDELIRRKVIYALSQGLTPILCVGESLALREEGKHLSFVINQLLTTLDDVSEEQLNHLIIAYEPIWAIGTGKTATPDQAQEMHSHIRQCMGEEWGETGRTVPILYGGSMKPANANSLLQCPDINGGLIGGASLSAESFLAIYEIAEKNMVEN